MIRDTPEKGFYDGCRKINSEFDCETVVGLKIQVGGEVFDSYTFDPKIPAIDRANGRWMNPWALDNPYREHAPMFVTMSELKVLDANPETFARCMRHYHSVSMDDGEVQLAGQSYVIIRPESPEKYQAICTKLAELRKEVAANALIERINIEVVPAEVDKAELVAYCESIGMGTDDAVITVDPDDRSPDRTRLHIRHGLCLKRLTEWLAGSNRGLFITLMCCWDNLEDKQRFNALSHEEKKARLENLGGTYAFGLKG
jgi:hypothetical protein